MERPAGHGVDVLPVQWRGAGSRRGEPTRWGFRSLLRGSSGACGVERGVSGQVTCHYSIRQLRTHVFTALAVYSSRQFPFDCWTASAMNA